MNQSDDLASIPLNNPLRRFIRVFLVLAATFVVMAAMAASLLFVQPPVPKQPMSGGQTALILVLLASLPLTISMLLSALITLPAARQADRSIADFRAGRCLVQWEYGSEEWQAYVDAETARARKINWWIVALVGAATLITGVAAGWSGGKTLTAKIAWSLVFPVVTFVFGGAAIALVRIVGSRRRRRLLTSPRRAYISSNAFYCGGDFNYWGSGMRALESVRLLPGPPPVLELVIGLSRGAKSASKAVNVAALVGGHPLPASSYTVRQRIPVPAGAEAVAEKLQRTLTAAVQSLS
jgi:hypothetical protein